MSPRTTANRRKANGRPVRAGRISKAKKEQALIKGIDQT
jgi:hypothetical protein